MFRRKKNTAFFHILSVAMLFGAGILLTLSCEESTGPQPGSSISNYHLILTAQDNTISSNGASTVISAKVYAGTDTTNVVSGVIVSFTPSLNDTLFSLVVESNQTDSNGIARARVFSGDSTGLIAVTVTVKVSASEQISDTEYITIAEGPGPPTGDPYEPTYIQVDYSQTFTEEEDGTYSLPVTALVSDINRNQVADGTTVVFTLAGDAGIIPGQVQTTGGIASTTLHYSPSDAGKEVILTVTAGDASDIITILLPGVEEPGIVSSEVNIIKMSVDINELRADGNTSVNVSVTLKRFDGSLISEPTTVLFETDLGDITQYVVSDSLTGTAVAQFTSNRVGTAHIKASVGEVAGYIEVFLVPGPPQAINLDFDPKSVGIQGSGRNVSLLVSATVLDERNNAVKDSNLVRFELIGSVDPEASLSSSVTGDRQVSQSIPTTNGIASVSFTAGKISGSVRVRATVVDEIGTPLSPLVTSETTEILVYSGPPYLDMTDPSDPFSESRVTLAGSKLNIFAGELNTEDSKSTISILIGDEYKNPVPKGTAIWLTTTGGIITTSSGYIQQGSPEAETEMDEGITYVTLYAGNPLPTTTNSSILDNPNVETHGGPSIFDIENYLLLSRGYGDFDYDGDYNEGIAIVSAYTLGLDHLGNQVVVWNFIPIVFSHQVTVFDANPDITTLDIGETSFIEITVQDGNGNPVVGGSTLSFSSKFGDLSTSSIVTSSPGKTIYEIALTNNLDPLTDTATNTVVNIELESPNGNYVTISPPIRLTLDMPL